MLRSSGHLNFDGYEQDQTLSLGSMQDGPNHQTFYQINDMGPGLLTPQAMEAVEKARRLLSMTPEERVARLQAIDTALNENGLVGHQRVDLGREHDKSVALRLKDTSGHDRTVLRVAADGTPSMEFLDATGRVTISWPRK